MFRWSFHLFLRNIVNKFSSFPGCIRASWDVQEVPCPVQLQHCFLLRTQSHLQGSKKKNYDWIWLPDWRAGAAFWLWQYSVDLWPLPAHRCVRPTPAWSRVSHTGPGDWAALAMALLGACRRGVRCGRGSWTSCWTGPTTTYCGNSAECLPSSCRKTLSRCRWSLICLIAKMRSHNAVCNSQGLRGVRRWLFLFACYLASYILPSFNAPLRKILSMHNDIGL